ncbi:MAG: putative glycosyl hydrolase [Phycisphaerales bacterium]|nr:putative glycosyl hydrolase [Phycisphaerales bacterium]
MRQLAPLWAAVLAAAALVGSPARAAEPAAPPSQVAPPSPPAGQPPKELWLYYPTNLQVDANVDKAKDLWGKAAAAGYTHVLLVDSKFARLAQVPDRYFKNVERVKAAAAGLKLTLVPALFDVGYSNNLLGNDPNLAEGLPVRDQPFVVRGGVAEPAPDLAGFPPKPAFADEVVSVDGTVATVRPGGPTDRAARLSYKLAVAPFRCYHVSVRVKTDGYKGQPEIKALAGKRSLQWQSVKVKPTQDWTTYDVVFNSLDDAAVTVYFGDWSYKGVGTLQWRDWRVEEAPLVNVLRRSGTPFVVRGEDGKTLAEGTDYEPVANPKTGTVPYAGEYQAWHAPAALKLKGVPDGTRLRVSWYHPAIVYDGQVSGCCEDPAFRALLADQAKRVGGAFGAAGYMMSHDEFRTFGWDASCAAGKATPGRMLADNAKFCTGLLGPTTAYVWNDMFDPFHNAVPGPYYLVNGSWAGSWEGLGKDVVVVNWNYGKRDESLKFFADRGHRQVIAGYYDGGQHTARWLASAARVPGVVGVMYTTWRNDYSKMEGFAREVRGR